MRTFTIARKPFVFEVCIFRDGAVSARRHGPDPLYDHTEDFSGISEAEQELGVRFPDPESESVEPAAGIHEALLSAIASGEAKARELAAYGSPLTKRVQQAEEQKR